VSCYGLLESTLPVRSAEAHSMLSVDTILKILPQASVVTASAVETFKSVEIDHRLVQPGSLFCCIPGMELDGHDFAAAAIQAGASGLLTEHAGIEHTGLEIRVPLGSARHATALLSAAVCEYPSRELSMVGITGTNGKTTVAHLMSSLVNHAGRFGSMIGTLTSVRTTPSAPDLHRELSSIRDAARHAGLPGVVAMEVSSHALDQCRVDGIVFDVAVFTNLTQDHLDYHGSMEAYFEAKAKLFNPSVSRQAVVWIESEAGRRLVSGRQSSSIEVGWHLVEDLTFDPLGTSFRWRGTAVTTPLLGRTAIIDLLLAAEACVALEITTEQIAVAMATLTPAPGRMQVLHGSLTDPTVVVDYAHTPDALEQVLSDLKGTLSPNGRLVVVFGCGGDRDRSKRPIMGAIAARLADEVVVTSDNPRSENPGAIIEGITAGIPGVARIIEDREEAIRSAIATAGRYDMVVVAGKGHESTQEISGQSIPFDDVLIAQTCLRSREGDA